MGWGHSYCILALRLLDYMGFEMETKMEWGMGGGGGGGGIHSSPTALGLGMSAHPPPTNPKFPSLVWNWEGAQKCFIHPDQTTGDFKSHHLQAWATLTVMFVPPFFLQNCGYQCYDNRVTNGIGL